MAESMMVQTLARVVADCTEPSEVAGMAKEEQVAAMDNFLMTVADNFLMTVAVVDMKPVDMIEVEQLRSPVQNLLLLKRDFRSQFPVHLF